MKIKEIEKFQEQNNVLPNQGSTLRRIKSINELTPTEEYFFRRIIILICIINSILGYYILSNTSYYILLKEKFVYQNELHFFIIIYSLNLLFTLVISFIIAFTIYVIYSLFIKKRKTKSTSWDEISLIPYMFTIFIISDLILYFSALPCSFFFLWKMWHNTEYSNIKKYLLLYVFLGINSIIGLILLYSLISIIIKNATHSVKQIKFEFNEEKLGKIKNEVKAAMTVAHKRKKFE